MAILISSTNVVNNDRSFNVIADTTAARNATPATGMIRYNTSLSQYEFYNGTVWGNIKQIANVSDLYKLGSSPVSVPGGFADWVQVSCSSNQVVALRANGTLWNAGGASPVSVPGTGAFTDWVNISTGSGRRADIVVRANGTAWGWGYNYWGLLGDNTSGFSANKSSPVSVVGGFTDWVQMSVGSEHSAGVRANGTIWSMGRAEAARLGNNTYSGNKSSPVSVVGGFTDWVQVSCGHFHSAALRANGTAWGWGRNTSGQLGTNNDTQAQSPVQVVGGFTDWVQISAGHYHSVAIRANGTAWAWGNNGQGRLGDNTTTTRSSPVQVVGGFTDWVQISAGYRFTHAIRTNGTAWAWGRNYSGILGDGTTVSRISPVSVVGGFTDWVQVSNGNAAAAAIRR